MSVLLRFAVMSVALVAIPASAGTLYKCEREGSAVAYSSSRIPGASCSAVAQYKPDAQPSPSAVKAAKQGVKPPAATVTADNKTAKPSAGIQRAVSGQLYSYIDKNGVRNYTSARPRGVSDLKTIKYSYIETCYACGQSGLDFHTVPLNTAAYADEISSAAREFGVDEAIVRAVIHAESSFNRLARSRAGAQGLMQLMPVTARRFGVKDVFDAEQNIRGGVEYLAYLSGRYGGDLTLMAAGYNAGEGAVARNGGVPPYAETIRYVDRVSILTQRYRAHLRTVSVN